MINKIIGKSNDKSCSIDYLHVNGIKEYNAKCISDSLAKYFANVGKNFGGKIPKPQKSVEDYWKMLQLNAKTLYLTPCTCVEIQKIISKLPQKHSHGHDNISNVLLKQIAPVILKPISIIINKSLSMGEFPDLMKLADVVPLFRSKERSLETNYRPIS